MTQGAHQFKAKPHAKAVTKFKKRMKELTCRSWGVSNSYKVKKLNQLIRGWINYFKIGSMKLSVQNWIEISDIDFVCAFGNTGKLHKTGQRIL